MPPQMSSVYANLRHRVCLSRRFPNLHWVSAALLATVVSMPACMLSAQQQQAIPTAGQSRAAGDVPPEVNANTAETPQVEQKLQIADQSASLLQMAKDLKAEVDATNSDTLSVAAFRKADAIERLAQSVKDKNKHANRKP